MLAREKSFPKSSSVNRIQLELRACKDKLAEIPQDFLPTYYFEDLEKSYFLEGLQKMERRWTKCIELKGDYIEK